MGAGEGVKGTGCMICVGKGDGVMGEGQWFGAGAGSVDGCWGLVR